MQQSRTTSREYAIILFCLLGVASINAWANNRFILDPHALWMTVMRAVGGDGTIRGYEKMTLYQLLDKHASDPKAVEALKGVAVKGQILRETAVDPEDPNAAQAEKVGSTFKLSRLFSESGSEEGAHMLSIEVDFPGSQGLEANMWVLVQGQVRTLDAGPDEGKPVLDAVRVTRVHHNPEQRILTPQGEMESPEMGGQEGHTHDENCAH